MSGSVQIPADFRWACAAGMLVAGEAAAFALPKASACWPFLAFLLATAGLAAYGWRIRGLGLAFIFGLGVLLAFRADARLAELLARNRGTADAPTELSLVVGGPVNTRPRREGGRNVDFAARCGPVALKVVLPVEASTAVPRIGETWVVDGWISRKEDRGNRFARRTLWVRDPARARCSGPCPLLSIPARWTALEPVLSGVLGVGLEWNRELAGLNRAILLGRRDGIPPGRRRLFVDAGTIHVFAISGLHVMVVAWMLNALLSRLGATHAVRGLFCLPPLWAYVLVTGAHPSAVRAAFMASFHLLAAAFNRRPDALASWSITALLVYGRQPERLFDLGCTFSFTVMLGIVLWMRISRRLEAAFGADSWRAWIVRRIGVPVAAWAAGVPIAAHVFGQITPGGLLANLVVVPCAGPLVKFGAGAIAAGGFCMPLAAVLNNAAACFTWAMVLASECVAALPFSTIAVKPWTPLQCGAWYAGALCVLFSLGRMRPRRACAPGRWWR